MSELRTARLLLRHWRLADRKPFAALNADPEVMEHFPSVLTAEESDQLATRIAAGLDQRGWGLWAVEVLDHAGFVDFSGFVGLEAVPFDAPFTPAVEIGWRLARRYWGQGLASEAAQAVLDHAFGPLGLAEVVSFTAASNLRSQRVMQRIGMQHHPADDFNHPALLPGHRLRPHVLYRLAAGNRR